MRLGGRHELRKVWVGDERTGGVENHCGSMRPGRCALTKSLKLSSLRSAAITPCTVPRSGALTVITGAPMLNET